jgi:hypothetical protein
VELLDLRQAAEQGMDTLPEAACPFSMDHPHSADPGTQALGEVLRQQFPDLGGPESVKIQLVGDGMRVRFLVHGAA